MIVPINVRNELVLSALTQIVSVMIHIVRHIMHDETKSTSSLTIAHWLAAAIAVVSSETKSILCDNFQLE